MNRKSLKRAMTVATLLALIVPALVTASVVVDYTFSYKSTSVLPTVFLAEGPNYGAANGQGLFYVNNTTNINTYTAIENNAQIKFNSTMYSYYTILLNVLEIVSTTSSTTYVWINGTLPSGVTLYYSTSPAGYTGTSFTAGTNQYSLGTPITLSGNLVVYLTFYITGQISGTGSLSLQYLVK